MGGLFDSVIFGFPAKVRQGVEVLGMEDNRNIPSHLFKRALQRDNGPGWTKVAWRPLALGNDGAAPPRLLPVLEIHFVLGITFDFSFSLFT